MKRSILISGIGKRNDLIELFLNEAKRFNIGVIGADASPIPPARLSVPAFITVPRADSNNFINEFSSLISENNIIAHLTLIDPEIPIFGEIEKKEIISSRLIHSGQETALLCEDKYVFAETLGKNGISVFQTSLAPLETYPYIRKDRKGSAESGFKVFYSDKECCEPNDSGNYIYQPFCDGSHYCVDAYFSLENGELIDFCAKQVMQRSKGESFILKTVPQKDFYFLLENIASVIPLRGFVNFDFMDDKGVMRLLEINCRIGGNYPASHRFGVNLIKHCLDEVLTGSSLTMSLSEYQDNQIVAKYFSFSSPVNLDLEL